MISYYTEVDIERCKNRIDAVIMSERFLDDGIRGEVNFYNNSFCLRKSSGVYNRRLTGLPIAFYGELIKAENGTMIQGEFRVPTSSKIPIGVWLAMGSFMWLFCLVNVFLGKFKDTITGVIGVIGAPIVLGLGILLMTVGNDEPERVYILDFIKRILDVE